MSHAIGCTCRPGASYIDEMCNICARKTMAEINQRLTPAQRAYDDYVDPKQAYHTKFEAECTCHLHPPCSFCMNKNPDE